MLFGVCPIISTKGPLHGMLGGRFILLFFACVSILVSRALLCTLTVFSRKWSNGVPKIDFIFFLLIAAQLMPQLFLSLFSTIGFSKKSLKLVFKHPALFIMPSGIKSLTFFGSDRSSRNAKLCSFVWNLSRTYNLHHLGSDSS